MALITEQEAPRSTQTHIVGLTSADVAERIRRGEVNAFEARGGRSYWEIFRYNVFNIFNVVLFVLLVIVLISEDYITVLFAGFSVVGNSVIGTAQELHAKRKLNRLADLAAQSVAVLRDGERTVVESKAIVKDEVIFIKPGDRLAVDGSVLYSDSLEMDESHLTGESDSVHKTEDDPVYSGSFCLAGTGIMVATEVGRRSTINRLAATARIYKNTLTPTQEKIATIVKITLLVLAALGPMIVISGYLRGEPFFEIVRNTIVFVTSLVPQGLIPVTTSADQGARQAIRRIVRDNPAARVVVTGCYATRRPDEIRELPNVACVVSNADKDHLVDGLPDHFGLGPVTTAARYGDGGGPCGEGLAPGVSGRTALTIRVQTGCAERCSYCIIPATRGAGRSEPFSAVIRRIGEAIDSGYREIAIAGVHLGSYGRDLPDGTSLTALARVLADWDADVLFRMYSFFQYLSLYHKLRQVD
jgi:hypothetical protein